MKPKGGSEIIRDNIKKYVSNENKINLILSKCHPQLLVQNKPNVILQELAYDQQNVFLMANKEFVDSVDYFVYVSHWQYEKFRIAFKIPEERSCIIKNAIDPIEFKKRDTSEKIRLIYTSTPWRGLNVLLKAFELLNRTDIELHVYSSVIIYGDQFAKETQERYQPLFDKAANMPNVVYHGYASNEEVRKAVVGSHIFAYPSIFEETSCISAIEAGAAGCSLVLTNFGAIYETCADFAHYTPYMRDYAQLAERYATSLDTAINNYWNEGTQEKLKKQSDYFNTYYNWGTRIPEWENLIEYITK